MSFFWHHILGSNVISIWISRKLCGFWWFFSVKTFTVFYGLSRCLMSFHGSFTVISRLFHGSFGEWKHQFSMFDLIKVRPSHIWHDTEPCCYVNTASELKYCSTKVNPIHPQISDGIDRSVVPSPENPWVQKVQHVGTDTVPTKHFLRVSAFVVQLAILMSIYACKRHPPHLSWGIVDPPSKVSRIAFLNLSTLWRSSSVACIPHDQDC